MFGTLRLILSLAVALSHVGVALPGGHHLGVPAVMVFLVLAGFVVSARLGLNPSCRDFYVERSLRLLPMYFACLAIASALWLVVAPRVFWPDNPSLADWLSNITLIPLNFTTQISPPRLSLLPPAWSLAMEVQFYMMAPWLLKSRSAYFYAMLLSAVWFSFAALCAAHPDPWGYRYLPAVLWAFLAGAAIQRGNVKLCLCLLAWLSFVLAAVVLLGRQGLPFPLETVGGGLAGIALVMLLTKLRRKPWDDQVGRYAYPVFLIHFPVWYGMAWVGVLRPETATPLWLYVVGNILVAVVLHHMVEVRLNPLRRTLYGAGARRKNMPK